MALSIRVALLNGPATPHFARTGRWQATARGASLWYPIWLAAAGARLEAAGVPVTLIDAPAEGLDLPATLTRLQAFHPDLVVIDTSTASITYDLQTAQAVKSSLRPPPRTCLVGPHASALPESVLSAAGVDFVAIGEYDETLYELAVRLQEDPSTDGANLAGLWGKNAGGEVRNPPRPLIADLDALPFASSFLARHLDVHWYGLDFTLHPYMTIMTSRGCPFRCTYCLWPQTLSRGTFRERSLDHVFKEIESVCHLRPAIREIFFDDDTFCVRPERVREFVDRYRLGRYGLPFSVNARADITDASLLEAMRDAGLRCVVVGFESGTQAILDAVRKGTRLDRMREFARICRALGIQVHGDFVIGLPGETKETIRRTVAFAKRLGLSTFQIAIAQPLPGTAFYDWVKSHGYLTTSDFREWVDADGRQRCVISYPDLTAAEMDVAVRQAIREFYLSASFLASALRNILRNPREIWRYAWGGMRLFRFFFGG